MNKIIDWNGNISVENEYTHSLWDDVNENGKMYGEKWRSNPSEEYGKLIRRLLKDGLIEEFELAIDYLSENRLLEGNVLDAACGVCWTTALLSQYDKIRRIDALDFSRYVLSNVAPHVIEQFEIHNKDKHFYTEKINMIWGSFYNIKTVNKYDLIFFSQGFHHAEDPIKLISECDRHLITNGTIVIIGEHIIGIIKYLRMKVRIRSRIRKLFCAKAYPVNEDKKNILEIDPQYGDHVYTLYHYRTFFKDFKYRIRFLKTPIRNSYIIVAQRKS